MREFNEEEEIIIKDSLLKCLACEKFSRLHYKNNYENCQRCLIRHNYIKNRELTYYQKSAIDGELCARCPIYEYCDKELRDIDNRDFCLEMFKDRQ